MKKIMILGAGASQIPLIRAAKRLGHHTIVCSIPGEYPGFAEADECCFADIADPQKVLEAAKKLQPDAVTTCGMDTGIRAIGRVCDTLGLCGITEAAAKRASDKSESKRAFLEGGVNCAASCLIRTKDELAAGLQKMTFPVLIKAVDLMGSRGIYLCQNEDEANAAFAAVFDETRRDYCLLEEYLEGVLFGAEGMITDGRLDFLLPYGTEVYHGCAVPTSLGHWVPFEYAQQEREICASVERALAALGIRTSPFNCDLVLRDGKTHVIEINGRAGASSLSETVGLFYGIDYYETIIRQALGEDVSPLFQLAADGQPNATRMLISEKSGVVTRVENHVVWRENLVECNLLVKEGDEVRKYENGRDRIGNLVVKGNSADACRALLDQTEADIHIEVKEERA